MMHSTRSRLHRILNSLNAEEGFTFSNCMKTNYYEITFTILDFQRCISFQRASEWVMAWSRTRPRRLLSLVRITPRKPSEFSGRRHIQKLSLAGYSLGYRGLPVRFLAHECLWTLLRILPFDVRYHNDARGQFDVRTRHGLCKYLQAAAYRSALPTKRPSKLNF